MIVGAPRVGAVYRGLSAILRQLLGGKLHELGEHEARELDAAGPHALAADRGVGGEGAPGVAGEPVYEGVVAHGAKGLLGASEDGAGQAKQLGARLRREGRRRRR